MKIEHSRPSELPPEEQTHLAKLRELVQACIADGKLSEDDLEAIRALINADHQVTFEELETIRTTLQDALGNAFLEYDWQ